MEIAGIGALVLVAVLVAGVVCASLWMTEGGV